MGDVFWLMVTFGGPLILILVIGYAMLRRRRLSAAERQDQVSAVRDIYRGGDGGPQAPNTHVPPKPEKDG